MAKIPAPSPPVSARLRSGLVSVSFRKLDVPSVVELARRAGLEGIEWGGDVHVPHGVVEAARDAAARTRDAGLAVSAYGSYYRLGGPGRREDPGFEAVLDSAMALGAPLIRVWAGAKASARTSDAEFDAAAEDGRRIVGLARDAGLGVALEYHADSLTDRPDSAQRLLAQVDGLRSFWQPPNGLPAEECLAGLDALVAQGRLAHLHVFHWWPDAGSRLPLAEGAPRWEAYLAAAARVPGERYCSLEFVKMDAPGQLLRDAQTLRAWLDSARTAAGGRP